jgi:hypothetical protein
LAEESGGVGRVREAFFEELVVWLVEVLVGHGSGERIGSWDAVASGNAANDAIPGEGELAGEWG